MDHRIPSVWKWSSIIFISVYQDIAQLIPGCIMILLSVTKRGFRLNIIIHVHITSENVRRRGMAMTVW